MKSYCIIHGRLTSDPVLRSTGSGQMVASFRLAVDCGYGSSKSTLFINCTAWQKTAELIKSYFRKGSELIAYGELVPNNWETQNGDKRYEIKLSVQSVDFCGSKNDNGGQGNNAGQLVELVDEEVLPF